MLTELELVRQIRSILGPNGEHKCEHNTAVDSNGFWVEAVSKEACKWCLVGVTIKVLKEHKLLGSYKDKNLDIIFDRFKNYTYGETDDVAVFNDKSNWSLIDKFLEWWEDEAEKDGRIVDSKAS